LGNNAITILASFFLSSYSHPIFSS
jgi:hypothetical protein